MIGARSLGGHPLWKEIIGRNAEALRIRTRNNFSRDIRRDKIFLLPRRNRRLSPTHKFTEAFLNACKKCIGQMGHNIDIGFNFHAGLISVKPISVKPLFYFEVK